MREGVCVKMELKCIVIFHCFSFTINIELSYCLICHTWFKVTIYRSY